MAKFDRVKFNTNLSPEHSCGIANVRVEGIDSAELTAHLWKAHKIIVTPIGHPDCKGIRVTPNVYTTVDEVDRFAEAMEAVIKQ